MVESAQFLKPHGHIACSGSNNAVELVAVPHGSVAHVLANLPCQAHHGKIQPRRGNGGGKLVCETELRDWLTACLRVVAGVEQGKVAPLVSEKRAHHACPAFWMPCTAGAVQVGAAEIADIVKEEGKPQPRVERETKKPGPRDCNRSEER